MATSPQQPAAPVRKPRLRASDEFRCSYCTGETFRRSRLRSSDLIPLLTLLYPVRCLRCSRRQYASYSLAGLAIPTGVKHNRLATDAESWRTWTSGESTPAVTSGLGPALKPETPSSAAPASTVAMHAGARTRRKPSTARPDHEQHDDIW